MKKIKHILLLAAVLLISLNIAQAIEVTVNDYDPRPAEAGKSVNVWFKVDNPTDDYENDVYIEIIPKDGLSLTSGELAKKKIGAIPAKKSEIVKFRLFVEDSAFKGTHSIEARITKGGESSPLKKDLSIEVTDKDYKQVNLGVGDIDSDPNRIKPDDENVKLEVTIQNIGDGKAQGVKAELINLPEGITLSESYSGTSLLGNIEADSTAKAVFYIDVDESVEPKEYTSKIRVSYKYKPDEEENDYTFETKNIDLKIAVKPIPLYEIESIEHIPEILTAGDKEVKLKIRIKNIGEEKGESIRIKAYGKTEQPINFEESSDFIAPSLEPGESGEGTLEFKIDEDANLQKYYIDLEIVNTVNEDVITYSKKIPIEITKAKANNPWGIVGFFVLVIAVVLIILFIKKNKKDKNTPKIKKAKSSYGENYLDKVKNKK